MRAKIAPDRKVLVIFGRLADRSDGSSTFALSIVDIRTIHHRHPTRSWLRCRPVDGKQTAATSQQESISMAPFKVNPDKVREFVDSASFCDWLSAHYESEDEVWIKIHKKDSGMKSINAKEAIDVVLCWGWIDAIRKGFDDKSFLQRYTKRGRKSIWSKINVDNVARLIEEGRMTEHGLREVDAAKADGRWDRAYAGSKDLKIPDDLLAAIDAEPDAKAMLAKLSAQNRFALAFRIHNTRTESVRKKKVAAFVEMLKRGETIYPQREKK
jgi:uncharacterized protein YdeI (YjbR/CyaY-like superfamily)